MISPCIGQIHLSASAGSMTRPPSASGDAAAARTSILGLSRPSGFSTMARTRTLRVSSLSSGLIKLMRPVNTSPGQASVTNSTVWPNRSHIRSDSYASIITHKVPKSAIL